MQNKPYPVIQVFKMLIPLAPVAAMDTFSSKDMAMKAQKKILSHMASKSMVQALIDDTSSEILDELYKVSKGYTGSRAEAQNVGKDLIKVAVKLSVLYRHNRFSVEELSLAQDFKKKLRQVAMTAISFYEVSLHHPSLIMVTSVNMCESRHSINFNTVRNVQQGDDSCSESCFIIFRDSVGH